MHIHLWNLFSNFQNQSVINHWYSLLYHQSQRAWYLAHRPHFKSSYVDLGWSLFSLICIFVYMCVYMCVLVCEHRSLGRCHLMTSSTVTSTSTLSFLPTLWAQYIICKHCSQSSCLTCHGYGWWHLSISPFLTSPTFLFTHTEYILEVAWHDRKDMGFGVRCTQVWILSSYVTPCLYIYCVEIILTLESCWEG